MANATLADIQARMPSDRLEQLCQPDGVEAVVNALIADSDAELALYTISGWTAAQKRAANVAFTKERLYLRHGTGKVPGGVAAEAERWRILLDGRGSMWTQVTYDPTRNETAAELNRLRTGETS